MKVKRVAVFDSIESDLAVMTALLNEYYKEVGQRAEVRGFSGADFFVRDFRDNYYDTAFLAVNDMRDVETARAIGQLDRRCPLFFVSASDDYGLEGFRLNILDYLNKPVSYVRLGEAISRIGSPYAYSRYRVELVYTNSH